MIDKKFMKIYNQGRRFESQRFQKILKDRLKYIELFCSARIYGDGYSKRHKTIRLTLSKWKDWRNKLFEELKSEDKQ